MSNIRKRLKRSRVAGLLAPAKDEGDVTAYGVYQNATGNNGHEQVVASGTAGNLRALIIGGRTGEITLRNGTDTNNTNSPIMFKIFNRERLVKTVVNFPGNGIPFDNGLVFQRSNGQGGNSQNENVVIYEVDD
jgi:hypothetical protein